LRGRSAQRCGGAGVEDRADEVDDLEIAIQGLAVVVAHRHAAFGSHDFVADCDLGGRAGDPYLLAAVVDQHIGVTGGIHRFHDFAGKAGAFSGRCRRRSGRRCGRLGCRLGRLFLTAGRYKQESQGESEENQGSFHGFILQCRCCVAARRPCEVEIAA
jgi:hypothetical protein